MEKAEVLNAFFAAVFASKTGLQEWESPQTRGKVWNKEDLSYMEETRLGSTSNKLDIHKSVGPDRLHTQVLRELVDTIASPLSVIFQKLWQLGEVLEDWTRANVPPIFKKGMKEYLGNCRPISLTLVPGKVMENIVLGTVSKHMKNKVTVGSHHGFMKGKSCLINLIVFCNEVTGLVDKAGALHVIYLVLSEVFDTVSS